jgi:hypothetical protein
MLVRELIFDIAFLPVGSILGSSRGHKGGEGEGDKLELHLDWIDWIFWFGERRTC